MTETRCWTKDDMPRALEWVRLEAKAGLEFRVERVNLVEALQELGAITEPQNLAQALRLELTEDAWLRLVRTLWPHERKAPMPQGLPAMGNQGETRTRGKPGKPGTDHGFSARWASWGRKGARAE